HPPATRGDAPARRGRSNRLQCRTLARESSSRAAASARMVRAEILERHWRKRRSRGPKRQRAPISFSLYFSLTVCPLVGGLRLLHIRLARRVDIVNDHLCGIDTRDARGCSLSASGLCERE